MPAFEIKYLFYFLAKVQSVQRVILEKLCVLSVFARGSKLLIHGIANGRPDFVASQAPGLGP